MFHIKYKLASCLSVIALIGGLGYASIKQTSSAIASYNRYIAPTYKITKQYNHRYDYRFHPNNSLYSHKKTERAKLVIYKNHPNKRYLALSQKVHKTNGLYSLLLKRIHSLRTKKGAGKRLNKVVRRSLLLQLKKANQKRQTLLRDLHSTPAQTVTKSIKVKKKVITVPDRYKIHAVHNKNVMYLNSNYPVWKKPYQSNVKWATATNRLADDTQAVKIRAIAESHGHKFYLISSTGYKYGWITEQALRPAHIYQLPFRYYSQLYPLKAPDACEAVALRMALSTKGHDPSISMRKFIDSIPRSKNPEKGYTANPYKYGDNASIYPKALAKYGRRYDKHVYPIKGLTKHKLITNLKQGNPIVYEGSYRMNTPGSDHTLVLMGYSDNSLEFADPYYTGTKSESKPISWVSISKFKAMFHCKLRGSRAVVVK